MSIKEYRKKPVVIKAIQYTENNQRDVLRFINLNQESISVLNLAYKSKDGDADCIRIPTLEGEMIASIGDYVICGVHGEFYPIKEEIFLKTYDLAL